MRWKKLEKLRMEKYREQSTSTGDVSVSASNRAGTTVSWHRLLLWVEGEHIPVKIKCLCGIDR